MKTQSILDQMVLVVVKTAIWQGRKGIRKRDLALSGIDIDKFPPESLAALGSKRIVSPDKVKVFKSLRRDVMRLCRKNGVRFTNDSYAVPLGKVEMISQYLMKIKEEFESAKANFISQYEADVEQWIAANPPEWSPIIRASLESPGRVNKAMSFNYALLDVKAPEGIGENGLDAEVNNLYGQLCHEVRSVARRAFDRLFVGKEEVSKSKLRPIKLIREKLTGMLFLDPSIAEAIEIIDDTLEKLPEAGSIKGTDLNMVAGLLGRQLANMGRVVRQENENEDVGEEATEVIAEAVNQHTGKVEPITWDF